MMKSNHPDKHPNTIDLNWLPEVTSKLTPSKVTERTLFNLLGVSTRELTISRVLAYYLDEDEDHGLGRLFLDSLLVCMDKDSKDFLSPYIVVREWNNIDILIQGETGEWAIILEDKIYHVLNNDLIRYWDCVTAERKAEVIVKLKKQSLESYVPKEWSDFSFVNVTHLDWLEQVKKARPSLTNPFPDVRQWVLINDFLITMENNTNALKNDPNINRNIQLLNADWDKIEKLLNAKDYAQTYIRQHLRAAFAWHDFVLSGNQFFYPDKDKYEPVPELRFYVMDEIMTKNQVSIYLELYGKSSEWGPKFCESIQGFNDLSGLKFDDQKNQKNTYYHLAYTVEEDIMSTADFPTRIVAVVDRFFDEHKPLVGYCIELWQRKQPA